MQSFFKLSMKTPLLKGLFLVACVYLPVLCSIAQPVKTIPAVSSQTKQPGKTATLQIFPASGPVGTVVTLTGSNLHLIKKITQNKVAVPFSVTAPDELQITASEEWNTGSFVLHGTASATVSPVFTLLTSSCEDTGLGTDLYISELYDKVPGNDGIIELYNPTNQTIVFNGMYELERAGDYGGAASATYMLTGSVAPNTTYLLSTGQTVCNVSPHMMLTQGINDNDEIRLKKNGVLTDIARAPNHIGYTVIRNANAIAPAATYNTQDWTTTSNYSCANIGSHTATPAYLPQHIITQPVGQALCGRAAATFTVSATNPATAQYQWKTLDTNGQWIVITNNSSFSGATTPVLTVMADAVLNGSSYYCEITYTHCTLISNTVQLTVYSQPDVSLQVIQPDCENAISKVIITPVTGDSLLYRLNNQPFQSSPFFENLAAGTYILTVKSPEECEIQYSFHILPAPVLPDTPRLSVIQPDCETLTGSLFIEYPLGTGFTYSIDGVHFDTVRAFNHLPSGTYQVAVKSAQGCTAVTTVQILPFTKDDGFSIIQRQGCTDQNGVREYLLELLTEGVNISDLNIIWTDEQQNNVQQNGTVFNVSQYFKNHGLEIAAVPLTFTAHITTKKGCVIQRSFSVESIICDIPKGISPNGDGLNDVLDLTGLNAQKISIYNRQGKEVYRKASYRNEWFGQSSGGSNLPDGTYFYQIELMNGTPLTGWIYLMRENR